MPDEELPQLPEPQEAPAPKESDQPQYEIEIVDDVPEPDKGKAPPSRPVEQIAGSEEADESFAPDAKQRIKQLRYVYHEERRNKEQAKREADAAVDYARRLIDENNQLKQQLSTGERVLVEQAKTRAEAQLATAKQKYLAAHEADDANAMVAAQEEMSRAVAEHQRFSNYVPSAPPQPQAAPQQYATAPPPAVAEMDDRTKDFVKRNPWFGQPGYEEVTSFAMGVHQKLVTRGIGPVGETSAEYWSNVEQRLSQVFPELFGTGSGNNGQVVNGAPNPPSGRTQVRPSQTSPRPIVAAGGARKSTTPVKVRLTQTQVALAHRLGLTTEQYAKEVAKQQVLEKARG